MTIQDAWAAFRVCTAQLRLTASEQEGLQRSLSLLGDAITAEIQRLQAEIAACKKSQADSTAGVAADSSGDSIGDSAAGGSRRDSPP